MGTAQLEARLHRVVEIGTVLEDEIQRRSRADGLDEHDLAIDEEDDLAFDVMEDDLALAANEADACDEASD